MGGNLLGGLIPFDDDLFFFSFFEDLMDFSFIFMLLDFCSAFIFLEYSALFPTLGSLIFSDFLGD